MLLLIILNNWLLRSGLQHIHAFCCDMYVHCGALQCVITFRSVHVYSQLFSVVLLEGLNRTLLLLEGKDALCCCCIQNNAMENKERLHKK